MAYTKMEFLHFHRLIHSHTMSQSDYRYSLSSYGFGCYGTGTPRGGVLEIGFVEENALVFEINEKTGESSLMWDQSTSSRLTIVWKFPQCIPVRISTARWNS